MQYYKKISIRSGANAISTLTVFGFALTAFGLSTSPAVISIATGVLAVAVVFHFYVLKKNREVLPAFRPYLWLPVLMYVPFIIWHFFSPDKNDSAEKLRIKLPLIILMLAGWLLPRLTASQFQTVFKVYIGTLCAVMAATIFKYLLNFEAVTESLLHSKAVVIVTLTRNFSHIYFGMMAGFGALAGLHFFFQTRKMAWLAAVLFLAGGLHFISNRTGLMCLYAGAGVEILRQVICGKNYRRAGFIGGTVLVLITVAFMTVPALKNKVINTRKDLTGYQTKSNMGDWSLTRRLLVAEIAADLIKRHPLTGIGPAQTNDSLFAGFDKPGLVIPPETRITDTHNQFLQSGVNFGIGGILLFILMLVSPFWERKRLVWDGLTFFFPAVYLPVMMTESILERQFGIAWFCCFWVLIYGRQQSTDRKPDLPL